MAIGKSLSKTRKEGNEMERIGTYIKRYVKGKTPKVLIDEKTEGVLPYLSPDYLRGKCPPEQYAECVGNAVFVKDGEVIVLWDGSNAGEIFISKKGILASTMTLLEVNEQEIDKKYFGYTFQNLEYILRAKTAGSGIPHADKGIIKSLEFYKPNKSEQISIANILSKVDEAIESVQGSIAAAERLKKSLMQNLLTGKMKPDGTFRTPEEFYIDERFGKVPVGWEIKSVNDLFYMNQNTLPNSTNASYRFRYITIESVNTESIDFDNCEEFTFIESPGRARRIIKDGDILISGVRPNLKAFAIYSRPDNNNWICSTGFHVLTAKENVCPQFFFYQILSSVGASQFHSWVSGSNYPAIGDNDMRKMRLYVPSYEEQFAIYQRIRCISKMQQEKQGSIVALEKLKKSLLQNLLTGLVGMC